MSKGAVFWEGVKHEFKRRAPGAAGAAVMGAGVGMLGGSEVTTPRRGEGFKSYAKRWGKNVGKGALIGGGIGGVAGAFTTDPRVGKFDRKKAWNAANKKNWAGVTPKTQEQFANIARKVKPGAGTTTQEAASARAYLKKKMPKGININDFIKNSAFMTGAEETMREVQEACQKNTSSSSG